MQYASEFGHLVRILSIFVKIEYILDELNGQSNRFFELIGPLLLNLDSKVHTNPIAALIEAEQKMDVR